MLQCKQTAFSRVLWTGGTIAQGFRNPLERCVRVNLWTKSLGDADHVTQMPQMQDSWLLIVGA